MAENNLFMYIFNVEHGNSIFVFTPTHKTMFIDCGSTEDFSPAHEIYKKGWYRSEKMGSSEYRLNELIITHPHTDHFSDINSIKTYLYPAILKRRERMDNLDKEQLLKANNPRDKTIFNDYWKFQSTYTAPASDPDWGIGVSSYHCNSEIKVDVEASNEQINNLSYLHILQYGTFKIILPGDLFTSGWKAIISKYQSLKGELQKANILIASHHGSDNGWPDEIFQDKGIPELSIISENTIYKDGKKVKKTDISQKYSTFSSGKVVTNSKTNQMEERKLLSTRNDGHIKIIVDAMGSYSVYTNVEF